MKVAIIGAGAISPAHVKGYLEFQDTCQIVALCDIYPDKAQALAKDFALDVEIYDDHKKMLERTDIDLVSVCTPPYTHADISIDRKSTRLNSSHVAISYAVFCLK